MAEEVELPEKLNKLEITHVLPQVKLLVSNLPVQTNPFFKNDLKDTNADVESQNINFAHKMQTTIRPATNCRRCRYRRASESALEPLKFDTAATDSQDCNRNTPSGILKQQQLKKSAVSATGGPGNRKVLLREPILKALQTCFHPHSNARKNLLSSTATNVTSVVINDSPLTTKGMSDFRNLIDECRSLLTEEVDFTSRLNQLCLNSRNSKNFTTLQSPKNQIGISSKLRNNRKHILNTASPTPLSLEEHQHEHHHNGVSLIQPPLLCQSISSTSSLQQRNSNSLSPEHTRCSTCSQQAGNSASSAPSSDDVTIDELASYFDNFVHIPKKMSSMAEMMYI